MTKPTDEEMIAWLTEKTMPETVYPPDWNGGSYTTVPNKMLVAIRDRLASQMPTKAIPLEWLECPPERPGMYIAGSNVKGRRKEAFLARWDGTVWQHWSGLYDHAITHYMPTDLKEETNV